MTKLCKSIMPSISTLAAAVFMPTVATATATYTYENNNKTYVATVTSAETDISSGAIDVLDANAITNFVVCGTARLHVDKGSSFTGDVSVNAQVRLSAANSLGVGPGKIYVTTNRVTMSGATVDKPVSFNTRSLWEEQTGIAAWGPYTSIFKKKVEFTYGNLNIYPYEGSKLVFEGGLDGSGCLVFRQMTGGTVVFTNTPINLTHNYPASALAGNGTPDSSGFSRHIVFAVAGNSIKNRFSHETYPFTLGELKTTVDWAFDNSNLRMCFGNDSRWDLCGTSQRVGHLDFVCTSGNPSVITNSLAKPAVLYVTQAWGATPALVFGGNLSVDFSGNKVTTINRAMTASGGIVVNEGTLAFTSSGSWVNATNVTVKGSSKITIASAGALGRKANVDLASNSSLTIASGVTVHVRTLTVGGVLQKRGDYTFGSGTLSVSHPCGLVLSFR